MSTRSYALLGSGEFEAWTEPVDRWLLDRSPNPNGTVLILPTASAPEGDEVFDRWAAMGVAHYTELRVPVEVVPLKAREDAQRPDVASRLQDASMVFFSGGNPAHLIGTLGDSLFWRELVSQMRLGLPYAGCSAGIVALGEVAPDTSTDALTGIDWVQGLRLFPGLVFGAHWDMLETYVPGLTQVILEAVPPGSRLLAVDEHTAVVGDGSEWTVMGSGSAALLDDGQWTTWPSGASFSVPLVEPAEA